MTAFGICLLFDVWSLVRHLAVSHAIKIMVILAVTFKSTVSFRDSDISFLNLSLKIKNLCISIF